MRVKAARRRSRQDPRWYAALVTGQQASRSLARRILPRRVRQQAYRLRRIGLRGWTRQGLRRLGGAVPGPRAGEPYGIGGKTPIVLHERAVRGAAVQWTAGGAAASEWEAFRKLAPRYSSFLDIGGGTGIFSAAFCALSGGSAHAFEPSPEMYEFLAALIELNPRLRIEAQPLALGSSSGRQGVKDVAGLQFRAASAGEECERTMPVETLDAFVERELLAPEFAKIDVEGMELDVLRGGRRTFAGPVRSIVLEVHPRMLLGGEPVSALGQELQELGFALFTLDFEPVSDLSVHVEERLRRRRPVTHVIAAKEAPV